MASADPAHPQHTYPSRFRLQTIPPRARRTSPRRTDFTPARAHINDSTPRGRARTAIDFTPKVEKMPFPLFAQAIICKLQGKDELPFGRSQFNLRPPKNASSQASQKQVLGASKFNRMRWTLAEHCQRHLNLQIPATGSQIQPPNSSCIPRGQLLRRRCARTLDHAGSWPSGIKSLSSHFCAGPAVVVLLTYTLPQLVSHLYIPTGISEVIAPCRCFGPGFGSRVGVARSCRT